MHPLSSALRPPSSGSKYAHPESGKRDLTGAELAQWAKSVPPLERDLAPNGEMVDVLNLRQRIIVGAPAYGEVTSHFMHSYIACKEQMHAWYRCPDGAIRRMPIIAGIIQPIGDSHVDRARNNTCNQWETADATDWLYWWDVDIEVQPELLLRTFALALQNNVKFLCGIYAMKDIRPTFVANISRGAYRDPKSGLIEVIDAGTGSMLWHRSVLDELRSHPEVKPYLCAPNSPTPGAVHWAYFCSGPYGPGVPVSELKPEERAALDRPHGDRTFTDIPQWLSEDWKACRIYQQRGQKVFVNEAFKSRHHGQLLYPPDLGSIKDAFLHCLSHNHPYFEPHIAEIRKIAADYKAPTPPPPTPAAIAPVIPIEDQKAA